jgi:glycosyltransferase involved in cell wall biosynthesis
MKNDKQRISVTVRTFNEEKNIRECLESLSWADELVVVDSGSTDGTVELAKEMGCEVASRGWTNYADQFAWALEHLPFETPWVMRLDADERLTPELVDELTALGGGERLEQKAGRVCCPARPAGPVVEQLWPGEAEHQ